jgi:hypothetical protein
MREKPGDSVMNEKLINMNHGARSSIQLFSAYCGLLYMAALVFGWGWLGGFLPPWQPTMSPNEVAGLFAADQTRMRMSMVVVMYAAMIFLPFAALISHFLSRIEGGMGVLSGTALLGGAGNMVLTFYPAVWWLTALYRPERDVEITYMLNDMAWLQFLGGVSMFDAIPLAIAVAAFCDKSTNPVFPRWSGYFNILVVLLILPDQLLFFFHSGPFAWSGVFGLWIPLTVFGLWFLVTFWLMRKAILRERHALVLS